MHHRRRILVAVKYRFVGDAVLATPALRLARRAWPNATISLLTGPIVANLLEGCPYLDDCIILDSRWREWGPLANLHLVDTLRRRDYDLAVLLNRAFQPALAAYGASIPHRIGLDTDYRGRLLTRRVSQVTGRHELQCNLDVVRAAGVPLSLVDDAMPELWVRDEERQEAARLLAMHGVDVQAPLIGMQPGTRRCDDPRERNWGSARFAQVADRLAAHLHAPVVLFGSAQERSISDNVAAAMRCRPIILTGETTLRQALALVGWCRLWVGNDSGLRHVAVALGVPTVAMASPANAARWGYDTIHHRTLVFRPTNCDTCNPRTTRAEMLRASLEAITPDAVVEAALDVWKSGPLPARGLLAHRSCTA
jgi:heptosyltransferase-2